MTKFDKPRDQVLHTLAIEGWGNESLGTTSSPLGYAARISVTLPELEEISQAFGRHESVPDNFVWTDILGHFIVIDDNEGSVYVTRYVNELAAKRAFIDMMHQQYGGEF